MGGQADLGPRISPSVAILAQACQLINLEGGREACRCEISSTMEDQKISRSTYRGDIAPMVTAMREVANIPDFVLYDIAPAKKSTKKGKVTKARVQPNKNCGARADVGEVEGFAKQFQFFQGKVDRFVG